MATTQYLGNQNLKAAGVAVNFTREQIEEYMRCAGDPIYFIINYKFYSSFYVLFFSFASWLISFFILQDEIYPTFGHCCTCLWHETERCRNREL